MTQPWFRKWMSFAYVPLNWQGWSVVIAMLTTFVPFAALFVMLADSSPAASWAFAGLAALSALVGHAIIFHKLDRTGGG